jgi:hypothetical protein
MYLLVYISFSDQMNVTTEFLWLRMLFDMYCFILAYLPRLALGKIVGKLVDNGSEVVVG